MVRPTPAAASPAITQARAAPIGRITPHHALQVEAGAGCRHQQDQRHPCQREHDRLPQVAGIERVGLLLDVDQVDRPGPVVARQGRPHRRPRRRRGPAVRRPAGAAAGSRCCGRRPTRSSNRGPIPMAVPATSATPSGARSRDCSTSATNGASRSARSGVAAVASATSRCSVSRSGRPFLAAALGLDVGQQARRRFEAGERAALPPAAAAAAPPGPRRPAPGPARRWRRRPRSACQAP